MKTSTVAVLPALAAVAPGDRAHAAPAPPVTIPCAAVYLGTAVNGSVNPKLTGDANWNVKVFHKFDVPAFQARRNQGTTSDLLWCDYRAASDENGAIWIQMSAVLQAPADHPKCTLGADQKSFICHALGSGETY